MRYFILCISVLVFTCTLNSKESQAQENQIPLPAVDGFNDDAFLFEESSADEQNAMLMQDNPLTGTLKAKWARQLGGSDRWVDVGSSIELRYEKSGKFGHFFAEGQVDFNLAFRMEKDSNTVQNDREIDLQLRELYWSRSFGASTLTLGNLITAWSVGDLITLSDRLSVSNLSRTFFANPEDIISGQNSIKVDIFKMHRRFSAVFVPYPLFDKIDDGSHPYSITPGASVEKPSAHRKPEMLFRLSFDQDRSAFSLLAGWVNNREPLLSADRHNSGVVPFDRIHKPYFFTGILGTQVYDPILLKAELIAERKRPRQTACDGKPNGYLRGDNISLLVGLDYNAGDYGTFTIESAGECIEDNAKQLGDTTNWRAALGWSRALLNDRLKIDTAAIALNSPDNLVMRLNISYDLTNNLTLSAKLNGIFIGDPDMQYDRIENYDRMDCVLAYHF